MVPNLMTEAINQMVFVPGLMDEMNFAWIRKRKVVYIPKKPQPTSPPDYRPLSMLEVFYMELILNGFEACNIHYSGCWKGWAPSNGCRRPQNHYVPRHINIGGR